VAHCRGPKPQGYKLSYQHHLRGYPISDILQREERNIEVKADLLASVRAVWRIVTGK